MTTSNAKRSELWQRLRAAREFAKKNQSQVAKAVGRSRTAITLWESKTPDNRTAPTAEQIMTLATLYNISPQYLLDDNAAPEDVYTYGSMEDIRTPPATMSDREQLARKARAFWAAVRFDVIAKRPELEGAFDVPLLSAGLPVTASFIHGNNLASFCAPSVTKEGSGGEVGQLLMLERLAGHSFKKHLMRWVPHSSGLVAHLDPRFEIASYEFSSIPDAASTLLLLVRSKE